MVVPDFGGCVWPMDPACKTAEWDAFPETVQDRALALASATLERLTGRRVSACPVTIRPCGTQSPCGPDRIGYYTLGANFYPLNYGGTWSNVGRCQDGCGSMCEVSLPRPVGRVDEVRVGATVISPSDYEIQNGNILVWTGDGVCPWPWTQDVSQALGTAGTFGITYLNAYPVDSLGAYAVGVLALEFAVACAGGKCRLPSNVTSIVRQGISMSIATGAFPNGMTGLYEVDSYIALWNPRGLSRQATVWNPDMQTPRHTTYTP